MKPFSLIVIPIDPYRQPVTPNNQKPAHYLSFRVMRIPGKAITNSGPCRSGIPGMAIRAKGDNAEIEIISLNNLSGQGSGQVNGSQSS
jgi:hypothetical protein